MFFLWSVIQISSTLISDSASNSVINQRRLVSKECRLSRKIKLVSNAAISNYRHTKAPTLHKYTAQVYYHHICGFWTECPYPSRTGSQYYNFFPRYNSCYLSSSFFLKLVGNQASQARSQLHNIFFSKVQLLQKEEGSLRQQKIIQDSPFWWNKTNAEEFMTMWRKSVH